MTRCTKTKGNLPAQPQTAELDDGLTTASAPVFLTERALAQRWEVSVKLLQKKRYSGEGVPYVKLGRLVRYRLKDVIAHENANNRRHTSEEG